MKIVLGSGSPRRKELLQKIVADFEVVVSDIEEEVHENSPGFVAVELAVQKARAVSKMLSATEETLVIGADTVVFTDRILGKPFDRNDAFKMLRTLSGGFHSVVTGVCVRDLLKEIEESFFVETRVEFSELSDEEIWRYIDTGEPFDKAGAYGMQGMAARFVKNISGCYFNVVGLPLNRLSIALKDMGYERILP